MSKPACPMCEMTEVLEHAERYECVTCGHEWQRAPEPEAPAGPRVVKDAHGNVLADGDCVVLIKDLAHRLEELERKPSNRAPISLPFIIGCSA